MNRREVPQWVRLVALLLNGPKTTNEIINAPLGLAAEYRRAKEDAKKRGYVIEVKRDAQRRVYIWRLSEIRPTAVSLQGWQQTFSRDDTGQLRLC